MATLFTKIIKREIPADIIYEDEHCVAFRDINPQAPVHILVIPKKHIANLNDLSGDDVALTGEMQQVIKDLAKKEKVHSSGYRVVLNSGRAAGQAVDHIHYHLLGGRDFAWPPG